MTLFSLEKTLGMLAMPVALIWLLILAVAGFCLRRRQWGAAVLCLALAALYGCAGNIHLAERLAAELERRVPPVEVDRLETFDAVCVLGGRNWAPRGTGSSWRSGSGMRARPGCWWPAE
jgi:hypothetical protein